MLMTPEEHAAAKQEAMEAAQQAVQPDAPGEGGAPTGDEESDNG
jgi:hypothetical protein